MPAFFSDAAKDIDVSGEPEFLAHRLKLRDHCFFCFHHMFRIILEYLGQVFPEQYHLIPYREQYVVFAFKYTLELRFDHYGSLFHATGFVVKEY